MAIWTFRVLVFVIFVSQLTSTEGVVPVCPPNYDIQVPKVRQVIDSSVHCFNTSDPCTDLDNDLSYAVDLSAVADIFSYDGDCLTLLKTDFTMPKYCFNLSATEIDVDPPQSDQSEACVIFNEAPTFGEDMAPSLIDLRSLTGATVTIQVPVTTDPDAIQAVTISSVDPSSFNGDFSVAVANQPVITYTVNTGSVTNASEVNLTVSVSDDGNPALSAEKTFAVVLVNDAVTCTGISSAIYIDVDDPSDTATGFTCQSSAGNTLTYSVLQLTGEDIDVKIDSTGTVSLGPSTPPGSYDISVNATSIYSIQDSFNITIGAGRKPSCTIDNSTLVVRQNDTENTIYSTFVCVSEGENEDDLDVNIVDVTQDKFFSTDSTKVVADDGSVTFTVTLDLDNVYEAATFPSMVTVDVSNVHGMVSYDFTVTVINMPPVLTLTDESTTVQETAVSGDTVYTFIASDIESSDNLDFSVQDAEDPSAAIPFSVSSPGVLTTSGGLNATSVPSYLLTLTVSDPQGLSDSKNFTVEVVDVNETPQCNYEGGVVTVDVELTAAVNQSLVSIDCFDTDSKAEYTQLTYVLSGVNADFASHFGFSDPSSNDLLLLQSLGDVSVADVPSTTFVVTVSDRATPPLSVDLNVNVNFIDKKPMCTDSELQHDISEKTADASCFNITHTCTDPTSGGLNFHLSDLSPEDGFKPLLSSFNLQESDASMLPYITICLSMSLDGQPGTYKANLNVSNNFLSRVVTLSIEVMDVNDPPVFNNIPTDSVTITEIASVADVVVNLDITDRDPGSNGDLNYTFTAADPDMALDFQLEENGDIEVARMLNATEKSSYLYTVTATDGGGLSESINLTITVEDVNQPPQCDVPEDLSVNATAQPGFVIGTLVCWDSDITPAYKTISYSVRSDPALISIGEDGTITLLDTIPYDEENLVYTVTVSNEGEGDSAGPSINLTVTIIYNKDFPPSCNTTSMKVNFLDTDSPVCGVGKVNCTSPVQTVPSYSITSSDLTENFRVETEDDESSISLRICAQDGFKDDIGTYQVVTSVTNGLGNVPITWDVTVKDVNEAPYFQNDSYYWELPENTLVGTTFAVFEHVDDRDFDPDPLTWDGLLLIQAKDPDVKTPSFQFTNVADIGSYQWKENGTRVESTDIPLVYSFGEFFVNGTLDVSLIYIFQMQVLDRQGLSASVDFTINVTDVNDPPSCNVTTLTFDLSLKVEVNTKLETLFCINDDYDEAKRQTVYTLDGPNKEYFSINSVGEIWTNTRLPRGEDTLQFQAVAVDGENSSLKYVIDVLVNVNRTVRVECNPLQEPPPVWVINSCVNITLNCEDPVADDSSTITYTESGNYTQGFSMTGNSGIYTLCYTKTIDGSYELNVVVDNGLAPATVIVGIDVVYLRSTPKFDQQKYEVNVSESAGVGETQLNVNAVTAGEFAGNITYSILDYTPSSTSSFFSIDPATGGIKPDKNLSELVQSRVFTLTVTVQATDDLSALKSTVKVKINVQEVNLKPKCQDVAEKTLNIDASIDTLIATLQCTDNNVQDVYNTILYSLDNNYFGVDADGVVTIKNNLPLTTDTHVLKVRVGDGGGLSVNVTVIIYVNMLLKPDLQVTDVTTTSVTLAWTFTREDYSDVIKRYLLNYALTDKSDQWLAIPSTASEKKLTGLNPGTGLQMKLYAETNFGNTTSSFFTAETAILTKIIIRYKDKNAVWEPAYNDRTSDKFKTFAADAKSDLVQALTSVKGFHEVNIIGLSKGSVYVDAVVAVNQTGNISDAAQTLQAAVYSGTMGDTEVEDIRILDGDKYTVIESVELSQGSPSSLNEGVNVTVKCPFRMVGEGLTPKAKWAFNDKSITSTGTGKFTQNIIQLDTDVFGYVAMLNIRSVKKKDEGVYACEVTSSDGKLNNSRSLLMNVVQKPTVDLRPLTSYVESQSKVELNCTVLSGGDEGLEFKWFRDGEFLSIPPVTEVSPRKQTLTIDSALANSAYYCQVSNVAGSYTSETSNIYIVDSDFVSCPEDEDSQGTKWPSTPVGQTAKLSCPEGYQGTVTRKCGDSGEWLHHNYTSCKLETLLSLQEEVGRIEDGIEEKEADEIIQTLANVTGSKPLVSGDIDLTIDIMERVVKETEAKEEMRPEFVQDVVTTADNMLKLDKDVWDEKEQDDSNGVTTLMKSLDSVGQAASLKATDQEGSSTNDSLTVITTERLVLAYGQTSLKNIEFPGDGSEVPEWMKNSKNKVFLNKDSFSSKVPDGRMGYSVIYYVNVEKLLEGIERESTEIDTNNDGITRQLNSKIVSFSLNPHIKTTLSPPVRLTFEHANRNYSDPKCSYLKYQPPNQRRAKWSSEGCVAVSLSENSTVCECDHLTNFAILMSPGSVSETHMRILSIISAVGCGISMLFLVITILIYCCLWRYVKSDRAVILINLCIALIIAYSIFLGGVTQTENKDVCTAISALLHYFFLVVFFLMLAEGVEVLVSVVYVFNTRSRLTWLLLLSWGVPLVVVGVSLGVTQLEGYGNHDFCWLSIDNGLLWAFVAPALLVIVANLVIICIVLRTMFSTTAMMTKTAKDKGKAGLKAICVLLPLMGVTWVFGVFSVNNSLVVFQYLFAVFNSLQGFFIFVFHCIVSRQVRDGMKNRRRRYRAKSFKTTGTESSSQIPASKLNSTSEEEKSINDLDKKFVSPFIDADRQVQQLANKLYPNRANMKDEPKSPKQQNVVPPVDPSDVKLHNVEEMETSEKWLTDGHVLLTEEPSIEENDAVTIGSPSTQSRNGAPPSPVKKNAWGEGKKSAPVHFQDYKLGETPQKKAGQLPPLKKKPTTTLVDHYGPPPPDILADPKIQNWRDQEEKIRESRDRLDQVYISQEPVPLHQDNRPKKPSVAKKSSSHSQKSRSSTSSGGRRAEPLQEEPEEVETIHLYEEEKDMPLYRGMADEPRPARPRSYGERKKRQQKYHNYEPPRVMVNSEEDLSRYGRRQPFGGIRTTANAGVPGLGRPRHQQDIRWQEQNYPHHW